MGCRVPLQRLVWTLLSCSLAPAMAEAQGTEPPGQRDAATLTVSALAAVDDNNGTGETIDLRDPQFRGVQVFTAYNAALLLNPHQDRFHWQIIASTGVRHYETLHEFVPSGQNVGGSLSFSLGRTTLSVSEFATYSPTYSPTYSLAASVPGGPGVIDASPTSLDYSPAALDYGVIQSPYVGTVTNFLVSQALSARSTVSVGYGLTRIAFSDPGEPDLKASTASARLTYRITKYASFHAGYTRRLGQYDLESGVQDTHIDDYDIGVDYSRALSLSPSPRTTLSFGTGSSIYKDFDGRHLAVTGTANLAHQFGRTGHAGLVYARGVGFVEGLLTPVFTDTVTASAGSALSRRLRWSTSLGYIYGNVLNTIGSEGPGNQYGSWTGSGQFTFAMAHRTALQAGYSYYQYDVGDAVQLLSRLPNRQRRQTLFVGLRVGVPLITERVPTRR